MTSSTQSSSVLLNRLLTLKENSPLLLIQDTIAQSSHYLVQEFIHNATQGTNLIYVSFETITKPKSITHFIEAYSLSTRKLIEAIDSSVDPSTKNLVIIDSINYISTEHLSQFITSIIKPNITVLTTHHTSLPDAENQYDNYPTSFKILSFIASTIFEILPTEDEDVLNDLNKLKIVSGLNNPIFKINLISRRKSGRSLSYKFNINTFNHEYIPIIEKINDNSNNDTQSLLKDLTTFNLTTSSKQKIAKESVELPYLNAQNFAEGGAIVYEFEKDDDYDEEDPYEDPF